jgi:hypothetical protein
VVVEPNIVRATAREGVREPRLAEPAPRAAAIENAWPLQPSSEPAPPPPPRPSRSSPTEEPWLAAEPGARPRPAENSLTGLAAELSTQIAPPEPMPPPRQEMRHEPVRQEPPLRATSAPPVVAEPPPSPQTDHNLAEMAQQLEAALRRTAVPEGRPPVTDALAAPSRDFKSRVEPKFEVRSEPKTAPKAEAKTEPKIEPKIEPKFEPPHEPMAEAKPEPKLELPPEPPRSPPPPVPGKTVYDNLEEEMASLLGRPSGKT